MTPSLCASSPRSEKELLERCAVLEGMSFAHLAETLKLVIPEEAARRKGWAGLAIELALGATAGTKQLPDFAHLGIELKTLPLNYQGNPAESTFITSIPLLTIHRQQWETSQCYNKLKRILWVVIEGERSIPFPERRIGRAILWSPDLAQEAILQQDWQELTTLIATGHLETIDATMGQYLQIRPKAANARSLCYGFDAEGNKILTLPRGFYLRSAFTRAIISSVG